jgi:hypothetical protein
MPDTNALVAKWNLPTMYHFLEERRLEDRDRIEDKIQETRRTMELAFQVNDKRLETMNAFRDAMADQAARMPTRNEFDAQLAGMQERIDQKIGPLADKLSAQGRPNWGLIIGFLSVMFGVVSGCWLLIGLEISVTETPLSLAIENSKANIAAGVKIQESNTQRIEELEKKMASNDLNDKTSEVDRHLLNQRLATLEERVTSGSAERRATDARFQAALTEIETQFCASDIVRNLIHANDLRMLSLLWKTIHNGETYPTDNAYYPMVCNRPSNRTN